MKTKSGKGKGMAAIANGASSRKRKKTTLSKATAAILSNIDPAKAPDVQRNLTKLAAIMSDVDPARMKTAFTKGERLDLRVSASEKAEIRQAAAVLGLSVSEYLTELHRQAWPKVSKLDGGFEAMVKRWESERETDKKKFRK